MKNLVSRESGEQQLTIKDWAKLNRQDHRRRIQEGEHPLISTVKLMGDDYAHGVIDGDEFDRRAAVIGRKIRAKGGLDALWTEAARERLK